MPPLSNLYETPGIAPERRKRRPGMRPAEAEQQIISQNIRRRQEENTLAALGRRQQALQQEQRGGLTRTEAAFRDLYGGDAHQKLVESRAAVPDAQYHRKNPGRQAPQATDRATLADLYGRGARGAGRLAALAENQSRDLRADNLFADTGIVAFTPATRRTGLSAVYGGAGEKSYELRDTPAALEAMREISTARADRVPVQDRITRFSDLYNRIDGGDVQPTRDNDMNVTNLSRQSPVTPERGEQIKATLADISDARTQRIPMSALYEQRIQREAAELAARPSALDQAREEELRTRAEQNKAGAAYRDSLGDLHRRTDPNKVQRTETPQGARPKFRGQSWEEAPDEAERYLLAKVVSESGGDDAWSKLDAATRRRKLQEAIINEGWTP